MGESLVLNSDYHSRLILPFPSRPSCLEHHLLPQELSENGYLSYQLYLRLSSIVSDVLYDPVKIVIFLSSVDSLIK